MAQVFPITDVDPRYRIVTATAGQAELAVTFPWQDNGDIKIYRGDATTPLQEGEHYTLTGASEAQGGTALLLDGFEALEGETFLILGDAELTRTSSITQGGRFRSDGTDSDLDRLTLIAQEIHRELGRTLRTAYGVAGAEVEVGENNHLAMWVNGRLVQGPEWGSVIGTPGPGIIAGGLAGQTLRKASDADFDMEWGAADGDVVGPAGAIDARVAVFDGTTGRLLKDGGLSLTDLATNSSVAAQISALVDAAPGALDTLNELAAALGDDANFAATVTTALAGKQPLNASLTAANGKFAASVQSTGRFGIDDVGGLFSYESIGASGAGDGVALRAQANFAYTGGTFGFVNSALAVLATAGANVTDFVWALNTILYNNAVAGENVAGSFTAWKQAAGSTWAAVSNAADTTGLANPTGSLVSHEFDVAANGTDSNNSRLGLHVVARRHNTGGADVEVAALIRLGNTDSHALAKKGIEFYTGSLYTNGIDLSPATISGDAIRLADNQKIAFDTSDSRKLYFDGTRLHYATGSNANALRISDGGFIGVNVAPAVAFDAAGTGDTQLRLVDGGTVDVRLRASSASAVGFFGSVSNHDMVVLANNVEAFRILAGGNVKPAGDYYKGSTKVVGARQTGWAAATGTATRTTFATGSVTLPLLAERVKALIDDLTTHGLIGT